MTARAHVEAHFARGDLSIFLGWTTSDSDTMRVVLPADFVVEEQTANTTVSAPSMRIPEDLARALLDALSQHFGGSSDVRSLRNDYDAERRRVDKLIGYLTAPEQVISRDVRP